MAAPEYTFEEQMQRLSQLQKAYKPNAGINTDPLTGMSIPTSRQLEQFKATNVQNRMDQAAANQSRDYGLLKAQEPDLFAAQAAAQQDLLNQSLADRQALLLSFLQNTADTSGYDAALRNIGQERNKSKKRYQTYSAQISDLFGNLGRKSATYAQEQAGIGQQAALTRSQLGAQQAQQAGQTRSADAARLKAATEARAALGLGEAASAGAAGDIATLRGEQGITDQQALGQTTIDTILANEALAKLVSSRQAGGFDMAGQQAQQELNMSYEDLLSSLANAEAQTKIQKSQAISAGAPTVSEQLAVMNADESYRNALANQGTVVNPADKAGVWLAASPELAPAGQALLAQFTPWYTKNAGSLTGDAGRAPTFSSLISKFKEAMESEGTDGAAILDSNPALISLLQIYTGLKN